MQLMCDAISVLGSRHGVLFNPAGKSAGIIRFDRFEKLPPVQIRAGVKIGERTLMLPLCAEGGNFAMHDQRLTPCTMSLMGIDSSSGLKVKLTAATPFRPRDPEFSTTPVLALRLSIERLGGGFRWTKRTIESGEVEVFLELAGEGIDCSAGPQESIDLKFVSTSCIPTGKWQNRSEPRPQHDRLVCAGGKREGTRFVRRVALEKAHGTQLDVFWCAHVEPTLTIKGQALPFRYAERFVDLSAVAAWARTNGAAIFENAEKVDGIVAKNNCSRSVNNLLAYTLHSWLIDSWWCRRPDARGNAREWFSVWEGNCYFHSTVDVEFTQTPFYLAVWPELLGLQLDEWPDYSKDGSATLGEAGAGTLFLSHDMGQFSDASAQCYPHEMEVEETTNYLILCHAYHRRTGDDGPIRRHIETIRKHLAFIERCDTNGDGVADKGVANTIDDASPAIQFGRGQVYLAVKTAAAYLCGAAMLRHVGGAGDEAAARHYEALGRKIVKFIDSSGWLGDHYATLLDKSGTGLIDPWSGKPAVFEEVPGWDAPHIYTANGLAVLDMVGTAVGLDDRKLATDLRVATERCLRNYGCVHTDFDNAILREAEAMQGLAGISRNPGWIAMNMLRDIAAFYRGVDLRHLADRYWDWQTTTNTQEPKLFFETFNGNNLCFYPRGVAIWGYFEALAGAVIDKVAKVDRTQPKFAQVRVPRLIDADWKNGTCKVIVA